MSSLTSKHLFHIVLNCHLCNRLDQFNRSLTLNTHDNLSNEDGPRSRTGGTGPGLGQRMSVEEIQAKQRRIIAG